MTHIRLIDFDVMLPPDVALSTEPPNECRISHTLKGGSLPEARAAIEQTAVSRGYAMRRLGSDSLLELNGQRIEIFAPGPARLRVRVDDAESLPPSKVAANSILIGKLSISLRSATAIQPRRERHDQGSTSWTAEWRVHGEKADELASEVHEALVQQGLRSNGIWPPPKGGIQRWRVEAYSPHQLVKASISDDGDSLILSVTLVAEAESA